MAKLGTYGAGHNWNTSYNWAVLVTLPADYTPGDACPFELPDIDGCFAKVYLEDDCHLRIYLHFKQPVRSSLLHGITYPGTAETLYAWTGHYWTRVDLQRKAFRIWELGTRPRHLSCKAY